MMQDSPTDSARRDGPSAGPAALFARFPRLGERVPWVSLGSWPTPVIEAPRFAKRHGLGRLLIKREDLSHPECGGNKVRGLEFLLGDAKRRRAGCVVTLSAAGSHHICRTAWHARSQGIETIAIVIPQHPAEYVRRNLLSGLRAGATYVPANLVTVVPKLLFQLLKPMQGGRGARIYVPPGGTSPLACIGHVAAGFELSRQVELGMAPHPDSVFVAMGSIGTVAGLSLGCRLAGLDTRVVGVVVSHRWYCTRGRWARLIRRTNRLMRELDPDVPLIEIDPRELCIVGTALGSGYAEPTERAMELCGEFREDESLELDPTYTGKAVDGMLQMIASGGSEDRIHLLWHTYHAQAVRESEAVSARESLPGPLRRYV